MLKRFVLFLFLIFSLSACEKDEPIVSVRFDLEFNESMTLFAIPIILTSPISYDYPFSTDRPEDFAAHNTARNRIEEVKLKEASIHIMAPEGANFGFLELVRFYINAEGLERVLIAKKENVSADIGKDLYLDVIDQDLSDFLKKDEIVLTVEVDTDDVTSEEMQLSIITLFGVKAKLL